ncbi:hypothetical protein RINTHH_19900 [Richelia intracellularis HH01]|uniref:Uncharacterized protein n=1 Tax=Richelia intracellularis HH01 TaxID=1165094 RepID=M1X387_9NOST|nr:hypothetical protein RINTHH_19900 [Richelia intracellularis HH01]
MPDKSFRFYPVAILLGIQQPYVEIWKLTFGTELSVYQT